MPDDGDIDRLSVELLEPLPNLLLAMVKFFAFPPPAAPGVMEMGGFVEETNSLSRSPPLTIVFLFRDVPVVCPAFVAMGLANQGVVSSCNCCSL